MGRDIHMAAKKIKANNSKLVELLKNIKLNESAISVVLGVIVLIIIGSLVFNYFKKGKEGTTLNGGAQIVNESPVPGGDYTVVKGDNLWKISEKIYGSGFKYTEIAKENNLSNPGEIEAGQKLSLPNIATTISQDTTQKIADNTYTVVKGDNLWTIAVRAYGDGYKWTEIAKANKLVHPGTIHSGNVLTLPR